MPEPTAPTDAADEKRAAADEKQLELAEQQTKLAEKLEQTAQSVASIAQSISDRPAQQSTPQQQQAAPARLTEDQVMGMVEAKQLTMGQAMTYLRKLAVEDARYEARRETHQALVEVGSRADQAQTLADIAEYKKAIPALGQRGSHEWNEVAQRYSKLIGKNFPESLKTELQALREIYGEEPSKRAENEPRERTKERATRGTEVSSSASARSTAPRRSRGNDPDPDLPTDHRTYIEHMIRIGQYKGWDDPKVAKYSERAKATATRKARSA